MSRGHAAELALLFNVIVWGATFVLVKQALDDVSPMLFLALRFSLAAAALLIVFRRPLRRAFTWKAAAAGALFGLIAYGIYDFTNLSTLRGYPLQLAVVDTLWGTFLCGMTAAAMRWASP